MIKNILYESFYDISVDEATVNNKPLAGEPYEITDPDLHDFDKTIDLDTEIKLGIKDTSTFIFLYVIYIGAYNNPEPIVIGHMDLLKNDVSPYPIVKMIRINPDYQGKGYGKLVYEWVISTYGGVVSDSTLSKRGGKGSFHVWKSLEDSGYKISVIKWSDITDYKTWEPKKISNIDNWVKDGKSNFRLVAE